MGKSSGEAWLLAFYANAFQSLHERVPSALRYLHGSYIDEHFRMGWRRWSPFTECQKNELQLQLARVKHPSDDAVAKALTKSELVRHCRRKTRGVNQLLENLIVSLLDATDTLGGPLLRHEVLDIWEVEKRHFICLQDPEGGSLYTKTGDITKGNISLPVCRCARGTTSLVSFHFHLQNLFQVLGLL